MVSQKVIIKNPTGLHLRPAGILCKEAMKFKSLITFSFRGNTANAKSVLSVLGACVKCGDEIEIEELCRVLSDFGYRREEMVEGAGQFGVRGGIVDYFPFWSDTVGSALCFAQGV